MATLDGAGIILVNGSRIVPSLSTLGLDLSVKWSAIQVTTVVCWARELCCGWTDVISLELGGSLFTRAAAPDSPHTLFGDRISICCIDRQCVCVGSSASCVV